MILRPLALIAALGLPVAAQAANRECAQSPGKVIELCVFVDQGQAFYQVSRRGVPVLAPSTLGLGFAGEPRARYTALGNARRAAVDTQWEQPWGEQRLIRDNHNELAVTLTGDTPLNSSVGVTFRLFDDGIGFRYDYGAIPAGQAVSVTADHSQFRTVGAYQAWWYEALGQERDEYLYTQTDARRITLAETPLTMKGENGLYLSFHEAALVDFPSMLLAGDGAGTLSARPMPWPDGVLARKTGPFTTPWRTVLIGESAGALADSRIELNLNEPSRIADISWFKPTKYVGVWWEMHLKKTTWGSGPTHGANTANVERYMDFAAKYGFGGVLVEGWNKGWDGEWTEHGDQFSFTEPYPDFDIRAITAYGKAKGVELIGHHETGGAVVNYAAQLEDAMKLYQDVGVSVVKTGYVKHSGDILDENGGKQWFAGQYMVRHHLHAVEVAAAHRIAIDAHEPVKDTGLRRTWPNMISREGARGQEFNAWGTPTNPPEHTVILPFTRMLAGPMDYTPGIFDITHGKAEVTERVQSTLATQLALYVVLYSPVQMAADLPENYEARPDAFQFIRDVPTDWETSRTLAGEIGDYIVVARQPRGGKDWFLGALTDEEARTLGQPLTFLTPGKRYEAQIYRDGPDADYRTNPTALVTERRIVTSKDVLTFNLAPGGGTAIRFKLLN
ncbi:glycoside hydrolase family 97 protein [Edaphosphingomonas haloaromaticamans]|uniref:Retaining alpha-galactosidase n=1 Tax=Edaphosphingomonas haloaromaticamans TaxID=653954 RepID=A0A1S1HCA8_9SPHN|nr:glycoside hydrolase family 97 protein [Sphingomonas haloaromaticamans]OHT19081.1 Retaining alpha-galactosidase precursor [Sphingomonas haloaromaticamans]